MRRIKRKKLLLREHRLSPYRIVISFFLLIVLIAILGINKSQSPINSVAQSCTVAAPGSATAFQTFFNIHTDQWSGADAGRSIALPDGRVLWLYGDTIIGPLNPDGSRAAGFYFVNNTAFLQDRGCVSVLTGSVSAGKRTSLILPPNNDESFYWLGDALLDGGQLKIFLHRYMPSAVFPQFVGVDLATLDVTGATPRLVSIDRTPGSANTGDKATIWGNASVVQPDFVYIYGTAAPDPLNGRSLFVARSPVGQLSNGTTWTYWNGSDWVNDQASAVSIIPSAQKLSTGISVISVANRTYKFFMISKELEYLGKNVLAWTADAPQGPWTQQPPLVAPIPDPNLEVASGKDAVTYLALLHPEATLASGKMLLSYSVNSLSPNFADVIKHGNLYNIHFLEVTLPGPIVTPTPTPSPTPIATPTPTPSPTPTPTPTSIPTPTPTPTPIPTLTPTPVYVTPEMHCLGLGDISCSNTVRGNPSTAPTHFTPTPIFITQPAPTPQGSDNNGGLIGRLLDFLTQIQLELLTPQQ